MNASAINFFFKYPEMGKVKTRLAADLGDEFVYSLCYNFIKDILKTCENIEADTIITYSGSKQCKKSNDLWNKEVKSFCQRGKDLGERIYNSFNNIFHLGYEECVIIGSDSPDLPAELLNCAFKSLKKYDAVIGPSYDGGYYLLGLKKNGCPQSLFEDIQWSSSSVFNTTMSKINDLGMKCRILEKWNDIDDINDLISFYDLNRKKGKISCTLKYLLQNEEALYGKIRL